jgi:hypothetical protein
VSVCLDDYVKNRKIPAVVLKGMTLGGGIIVAGIVIGLFTGVMDRSVPTHAIAIENANACDQATESLGAPIEMLRSGTGTYRSEGSFGASTWSLTVKGGKGEGELTYAAEKHGGKWSLTALNLATKTGSLDLMHCDGKHATAQADGKPRASKAERRKK